MTDNIKIYHNPRCTKSRLTLKLLEDSGYEPEIIEYLKESLAKEEVTNILDMLGLEPREFMRKKESEYKDNNFDNPNLSREELIKAIVDYPKLFERPVIVSGDKAVIGRPPENIFEIL